MENMENPGRRQTHTGSRLRSQLVVPACWLEMSTDDLFDLDAEGRPAVPPSSGGRRLGRSPLLHVGAAGWQCRCRGALQAHVPGEHLDFERSAGTHLGQVRRGQRQGLQLLPGRRFTGGPCGSWRRGSRAPAISGSYFVARTDLLRDAEGVEAVKAEDGFGRGEETRAVRGRTRAASQQRVITKRMKVRSVGGTVVIGQ